MTSKTFDRVYSFQRIHHKAIDLLLPLVHSHLSIFGEQFPPTFSNSEPKLEKHIFKFSKYDIF